MIRVLSLGAGVQSTTVLLMSLEGELPPLDAAIFADTGWEPQEVYAHLWGLAGRCAEAGLPLYVVSAGDLRADALGQNPARTRSASLPVYVDTGGKREGRVRRQCTREYKIEPIRKQLRALLGLRPRQAFPKTPVVEQWFGISLDEVQRMRDPDGPWLTHSYLLIDLRMTRHDCQRWLEGHGVQAPRSACIGCPFHSDTEWRGLSPQEWADAVAFDAEIRGGTP